MVLDALLARLVHYADHYVGEDAELEEEAQLDAQVEGPRDVHLAEVEDQRHALEPVREEGRQVIVELAVYQFEVVLEVGCEAVYVVEDLLEVLLDDGQDAGQLDVAQARDDVVGDGVVLVAD